MAQVLVLATMATKTEETEFLLTLLRRAGVTPEVVDISLRSDGQVLDGDNKCIAMAAAADAAIAAIVSDKDAEVVLGIGGGTGGEIALQVMRALPITFPKLLVTTLPFDPRFAVADNAITIIPTLADISGLNDMLRDVFENAALMAAGICRKVHKGERQVSERSVGITALGATEGAVKPLVSALTNAGRETTVFHSNGFGGAAFARFAEAGAFDAIVELTPHELTRMHVAGIHAAMPTRFSAAGDLPRVILPGALNFIGLGPKDLMPERYLDRPHYQHSLLFTHVKLTPDEMDLVSRKLADAINAAPGPNAVLVPMGGFSHHDRPGGAIEDADLREVCAETLEAHVNKAPVARIDAHLFDPSVTDRILDTLADLAA